MGMPASQLWALIKVALPDASIVAEDLSDDGTHYAISVVSDSFRGMSEIKQRQLISSALKDCLGRELHTVALQTSVYKQPNASLALTEQFMARSRAVSVPPSAYESLVAAATCLGGASARVDKDLIGQRWSRAAVGHLVDARL